MTNCSISFSYPWLLLLLIPAFALALIPYFRLSKKYRKTRNRISSIVLHCIAITLAITVLSGMMFNYEVPSSENELILLVDVSDTEEVVADNRDDLVQTILDYTANNNIKVGVVTFGLDQRYAVPLTNKTDDIFDAYLNAELPDVSATDLASALTYAGGLFTHPKSSKIVLITDGKETDRNAKEVIRAISEQGTRIDTAFIPSEYSERDAQVVSVSFPDHHVNINEECRLNVTVYSNDVCNDVNIELFDNGTRSETASIMGTALSVGEQSFPLRHTFTQGGLHEITVKVSIDGSDLLSQNNEYLTHYYLEVFNNILVLESTAGQSEELKGLISNQGDYAITVLNVYNDKLPATVDELREYDQVILNNIANADIADITENPNLPVSEAGESVMVANLMSYVNDYGGGLLTLGGNDEKGEPHAYRKEDMEGSLFQQMLPIQATNYVPPIGLVVIIDRSGSMGGEKLEVARTGAAACLDALVELGDQNYFGLMTLDSAEAEAVVLDPTPVTRKEEIQLAIDSVNTTGGGTVFPGAIRRAAQALRACATVDKRHIIIVTDGQVPSDQVDPICNDVRSFHQSMNLTISIVVIAEGDADTMSGMQKVVDAGKNADGTGGGQLHVIRDLRDFVREMREDLNSGTILEVNDESFTPTIKNLMSPIFNGVERGEGSANTKMTVELGGFYGVKRRLDAELLLTGEYDVPIYVQWTYGRGMVGSFMCDLQNSAWSAQFMSDPNGGRVVKNIINNLMPKTDISAKPVEMTLREDNINNNITVKSNLAQGQRITGEIVNIETGESVSVNSISGNASQSDVFITAPLNEDNRFTRFSFGVKKPGVYSITLRIVGANGTVVEGTEASIFKSFAYSAEYDLTFGADNEELKQKLQSFAVMGKGEFISDNEDPTEVLNNFTIYFQRTFDPKTLFLILVIILFLLDIAVRKFKFKWPHELIREYMAKKSK